MVLHALPTYAEVLDHLNSFQNMETAGVTRSGFATGSAGMAKLTERLGSPQAAIPAVHVAGTKGKGSTCHLVTAALAAAGFRTGLYTSPHVTDIRERIQIRGRPIEEDAFTEAAATVLMEAENLRAEGAPPSWFEVMTAVALVAFRDAGTEAMVLETGLGGRLDSTNMPGLKLVAAGLAAISRDHEDILGSSLAAIAAEKAAIIRPGVPVVTAPQEEGVMKLIETRAREQGSILRKVGRDITVGHKQDMVRDKPIMGQRLNLKTWRGDYPDIPLAMLGRHQAANAALALGLTDIFLEYMDFAPLEPQMLKRAWRTLQLPARMEAVSTRPWHIIDGAHNPASAWAAAETVEAAFGAPARDRTLVFGVAGDKDFRAMLRILAPLFSRVIFTPYASSRSVDPEELAAFAAQEFPSLRTVTAGGAADALEHAKLSTPKDGLILTTGSLWLAGEMRAIARK